MYQLKRRYFWCNQKLKANLKITWYRKWTCIQVLCSKYLWSFHPGDLVLLPFVFAWVILHTGVYGVPVCVVAPLQGGSYTLPRVAELYWSTYNTQVWCMAPRSCSQSNGHTLATHWQPLRYNNIQPQKGAQTPKCTAAETECSGFSENYLINNQKQCKNRDRQ